MRIKRSLALLALIPLCGFSVPTIALGFDGDALTLGTILKEPWFIGVAAAAFVLLVITIKLALSLVRTHHMSCKNTTCSYHPLYLKSENHYDFSAIETPDELVETTPDTEPASPPRDCPGVVSPVLPSREPKIENDASLLTFERRMLNPLQAMEFTDDMVLQVVNALQGGPEEEEYLRRVG